MTSEYPNRRHTDRGYIYQVPAPLTALRNALGLGPVTETLSSLSHWRRRRPAASQETGASS